MATLHLKAWPNARQNAPRVAPDGTVTARLAAPPHDGQANACLLAYLADVLNVAKSGVGLRAGHAAPFKKIDVTGLTNEELRATLQKYAGN